MVAEQTAAPNKREAILAAALDLFVERGFHGTAMPSVAKLAHVGAGTIYRYFASKEALVNELYRRLKQSLSEQVVTQLVADAAPRRQFAVYFGGMCRFLIEQPKAFAFLELHHHASYLDDESLAVENQMVDLATSIFERAQRQGAIKTGPPVVLMAIVYGSLVGFARAGLEKRIEFTDENQALAEECCWAAISA